MNTRERKDMLRFWPQITVSLMVMALLLMIMPMSVWAAETSGTLGDNDGIQWSYDAGTRTLTITGEDSGLQGTIREGTSVSTSQFIQQGIDRSSISKVVLRDCTIKGDASFMFSGLYNAEGFEFHNVDFSQVTDATEMFSSCGISELDLSGLDFSSATTMQKMFFGCNKLESINLSGLKIPKVTDMSGLFYSCFKLKDVDLTNLDTSNVEDMSSMFFWCDELESIDLSDLDTSSVTDMGGMFYMGKKLKSIDMRGLDTSQVTDMSFMFFMSQSLESVDMSGLDTSNVEDMTRIFFASPKLKTVNLSGIDMSSVAKHFEMLAECKALETIYTPKKLAEDMKIGLSDLFVDSENNRTGYVTDKFCDTVLTKAPNPFSDVNADGWQYSSVIYVYSRGLMTGKGNDETGNVVFDPNKAIPREEFVQVLYNASGKPPVSIENEFPDVKDTWYKTAVLWAKENDIANGKGDGSFGVTESIRRQDLALMLYKYALLNGYELTGNEGEINKYADGDKVDKYAQAAMDWAITYGIMSGKGNKGEDISTFRLDPTGTATRAECAAMLKNYMTVFGN